MNRESPYGKVVPRAVLGLLLAWLVMSPAAAYELDGVAATSAAEQGA